MSDMRTVIEPKSDQLNADDLIGGARVIRIREVRIAPSGEQRVSIFFDGDNGKPWKPCKSMCRVLVELWGPDANAYAGRRVALFKDPKVKWGGLEVGGIRIARMSHIDRDMVLALTETRGKRAPFLVKPLPNEPAPKHAGSKVEQMVAHLLEQIAGARDMDALMLFIGDDKTSDQFKYLKLKQPEHHEKVESALLARKLILSTERTPGSDDE